MKKLISLCLVGLLLLSAGCTTTESKTEVFTGQARGYGGPINVEVTKTDGKIVSINVEANDETSGVGDKAIESLVAQIIEKNSYELDTVAGATVSSTALLKAVKTAIETNGQATGNNNQANDGKYLVEVIGHEGAMNVAVMFKDGAIKSIEVLRHNETQGIGTYAISRVPNAIIENQSINVDTVSGATLSSNAIIEAVEQAIVEAGGDVALYSSEVATVPVVEEVIQEDVQVAIMGAGTAGLFAATKLVEEGITDIIIFEKLAIPGGTMSTTYGGIVVADSEVFNNWGLGNPIYSTWDVMREAFKKGLDAQGVEYLEDLPWSQQVFVKSGEVFDWMVNNGIGYNTFGSRSGYGYPYMSPGAYDGGAGYAMEFLVKRLESKGIRIVYETPVTDFVANENGDITGLIAQGADGKTWEVNADAVLVASGSFAKNQELLAQHYPEWKDNYFNTIKSVTGDGLILGQQYGAGIEEMGGYLPGFMSSYDSKFELAFMHLTTPGIIVNINGNEFGDHVSRNHESMSAAKADPSNGDTFYYIFDDAAAQLALESKNFGFDTYKAIFEKGEAVHYASVEECAKALNLENLQATIDLNNQLALAGENNEFGRRNLSYIETRDGIWVLRVDPNVYLTTGGLKIDLDTRVLTQDNQVIKGLYAAGDVVGSVEQRDGRHYAYGFNSALAYGTIAAETIIEDYKLK